MEFRHHSENARTIVNFSLPLAVAVSLAELAEENVSLPTLRLQKSDMARVHRSAVHQDPIDDEGVRQILAGISRANCRPQRQAIRGENARDAEGRGRVDIALLSVLRAGCLGAPRQRTPAGDVELQDAGAVHRAPDGRTGCGGQVLPEGRGQNQS